MKNFVKNFGQDFCQSFIFIYQFIEKTETSTGCCSKENIFSKFRELRLKRSPLFLVKLKPKSVIKSEVISIFFSVNFLNIPGQLFIRDYLESNLLLYKKNWYYNKTKLPLNAKKIKLASNESLEKCLTFDQKTKLHLLVMNLLPCSHRSQSIGFFWKRVSVQSFLSSKLHPELPLTSFKHRKCWSCVLIVPKKIISHYCLLHF